MRTDRVMLVLGVLLFGAAGIAAYLSQEAIHKWWTARNDEDAVEIVEPELLRTTSTSGDQVRLSPQARQNLQLTSRPLTPRTYWKTIEVPGVIVDRPGVSDRGVVAPVTGIVTRVISFPGDTVEPGDVLFLLRLTSESLNTAQMELFKASRDTQIAREQKQRLTAAGAGVPQSRIIEIDNELRRLEVVTHAYRQDLQTRGLTPEQIDAIAEGTFLSEVEVRAPPRRTPSSTNSPASPQGDGESFRFEVQDLKVELGQQVQAGQTMCLLSDHSSLLIEGRCFPKELGLVQQATLEGWPLTIEFLDPSASLWPELDQEFRIEYIANTMEMSSRTLPFYVPLANQRTVYERDGRQLLLWRFRPGQRVRVAIRVERLEDVFVLPAEAVAEEGPEAYVFRQNGSLFERKPVRVLYKDQKHVVIANDGSVPPGVYVAQGAALQLNRVLKSQSSDMPKGFHVHADGSVHMGSH